MQSKTSFNRRDFSPMSEIKGKYKNYFCFENYWQSGKVYEGIDVEKYKNWWQNLTQGKRRYPNSKGKRVLHSIYPDGIVRDYITSRKEIYVPEYFELMINTDALKKFKKLVESGKDVVIYDFDGPKTEDGELTCLEVNLELLKAKINDDKFPFGHGYVVAGALAGYNPVDYCK